MMSFFSYSADQSIYLLGYYTIMQSLGTRGGLYNDIWKSEKKLTMELKNKITADIEKMLKKLSGKNILLP